jgi:hypothetical protein
MDKRGIAAVAVVAAFVAGCTSTPSQGKVTGTIVDRLTGEPLRGVVVSAGDSRTETDRDGVFELRGVTEGAEVVATVCSHESSTPTRVQPFEEPSADLGKIELQPTRTRVTVTSNLTKKGIKATVLGPERSATRKNGKGVVRGVCPGDTLRVSAPGYARSRFKVSAGTVDVVMEADPATTAEYVGELESKGRLSDAWDLIHPDVKTYATERDYRAAVNEDVRAGYQVISVDVKSFRIIRWLDAACEYSDFGPKIYPRTAAVEVIYHNASPAGGGYTQRQVTHWVQTKDGFWRWFANVGCRFPAP